jgi:aspartate racemase
MRRVGILGGMGPEATVLLMRKLIDAVPARDDADHVPLLVDQNPQVPSRITFLIEGRGEDPGPVLAGMARRLEAAGAEALAMPCNTAHHFADAIRGAVRVPFLDMVALSVTRAWALAGAGGQVGVLASPAVRKVGLFDGPLAEAGLTPVYPGDEAALLAAIRGIKAEGPGMAERAALGRASAELLERGARVQMIACTEFSLIPGAVADGALAFDTLDVLTGAIVAFARGPGSGPVRTA